MNSRVKTSKALAKEGFVSPVSVTPDRPRARTYHMGTVFLSGVTFKGAEAVGEVIHEDIYSFDSKGLTGNMVRVDYNPRAERYFTTGPDPIDVSDGSFNAAVFIGPDIYVSKDGI